MFKRKKQQSIIPKQVEMLWSQKIRGRRRIFRREEQKGIVDFCRLQWRRKVRYRFPVTSSLEYAYRKTSQNVFLMWDNFFFKKLRGSLTGSPYLKALMFDVCFRGISRLPSAFVFLRWFKLAHISIQVCTLHDTVPEALRAGVWEGLVNGSHTANARTVDCFTAKHQRLYIVVRKAMISQLVHAVRVKIVAWRAKSV